MKDNLIWWLPAETKTCHICFNDKHIAANCPITQDREKNERKSLNNKANQKMSHLAPEQLTGATENPNKNSEVNNASNWTQVESKNCTKKTQETTKEDPKPLQASKTLASTRLEAKKQLQTSQKKSKNSEIFSLPQQTTRDSIHAVIGQTGNTDISPPAENGSKQNVDMQQQKNSLPRPDQTILSSNTNAELPKSADSHQANSQSSQQLPTWILGAQNGQIRSRKSHIQCQPKSP